MTPQLLEHVRAEALFVSDVQSSDPMSPEHIRTAVMRSVRRHGPRGCAALVAHESVSTPTPPSTGWVGCWGSCGWRHAA